MHQNYDPWLKQERPIVQCKICRHGMFYDEHCRNPYCKDHIAPPPVEKPKPTRQEMPKSIPLTYQQLVRLARQHPRVNLREARLIVDHYIKRTAYRQAYAETGIMKTIIRDCYKNIQHEISK